MTKTETAFFSINKVTVTKRRVQDLLWLLFECGRPSWLHGVINVNLPEGLVLNDFKTDNFFCWTQIVPVTDGCSLTLLVNNPDSRNKEKLPEFKEFVLDIDSIQKGLEIMAEKYPSQWKIFIDENDDKWSRHPAVTSDIFGQCVVYGEIIYG